jgi:acyl-coenzyme A synthetase/AMP-(fatty) acid ligase
MQSNAVTAFRILFVWRWPIRCHSAADKGYQVAPAELEAVLLTHPHIKDAAVIRSPDEEAGEVPKAFVVSDGSVSAQDVMDFVAERVAPHKKIRRVEFVDEVPKSASGKILRRVLIDRELAAMEQAT